MRFRRLLFFARPHRTALAGLTLLTVLSSLVLLAVPWLAAQMISGLLVGRAPVGSQAGLLLGVLVLFAVLNVALLTLSTATSGGIL